MSMPRVSVVIPCYNAERWLAQTIASVRAQRFDGIEIVCVDDGSRDGTAALLERLAGPDLRLVRQENRGQSAAANLGQRHARADYIQFLDADDLLHPDKIAAQYERLQALPMAVAVSAWARFHDDPGEARFVPEPCWRDGDPMAWLALAWHEGGGMLYPGRWLLPRRVLEAAGPWDESLTVHNDGEFFTRVVLASSGVVHVDAARAYYRSGHGGNVSARRDRHSLSSYHRSLALMAAHVGGTEAPERVRHGLALMWQRFAHGAYPYTPDLAEDALLQAARLHDGARLPPDGGWRFRVMRSVLGWRLARRMQRWSGRP
jgi:glycosyltransferase involved in cell wall biosynthesis